MLLRPLKSALVKVLVCEFATMESILNVDEFPSEIILQDIVEFIHGEESLLL